MLRNNFHFCHKKSKKAAMSFIEQHLLYLFSYSLFLSTTMVTSAEVHQDLPFSSRAPTSHGDQVQHQSNFANYPETPEEFSIKMRKMVSRTSNREDGHQAASGQEGADSLDIQDAHLTEILAPDEIKSPSSSNFLTPANPLWTEVPPKFSLGSSVPAPYLLETEHDVEPFRPSERGTGSAGVSTSWRQSTNEWDSSAMSPILGEEESSLTSVSSFSFPGYEQPLPSTLEPEYPGPDPLVEVPSPSGPALIVQPSTEEPNSSSSVRPQSQYPMEVHQDTVSPAMELPEYSVIYTKWKNAESTPTDVPHHIRPYESTTDVKPKILVVPSTWTSTLAKKRSQSSVTSTPGTTDDAGLASTQLACDPDNNKDCGRAATQSTTETTADTSSYFLPFPPLFITLHSDWNTAMADWGLAWEIHVYAVGSLFGLVAFISLLSLLCLPFRCPSGCRFFVVLDLLLISAGCSRAFSMFYDAYSHQERLPAFTALLLHDVTFPCLTSALAVVFLLLSMRSRMPHSHSRYHHACALATIVFLHFFISMGAIIAVDILHQFPFLLFVSRGVFVAWTAILSLSFFVFYCVVKPDQMQLYNLKCSIPTADYMSRCPLADSADWSRAAQTALFSAMFGLFSAGLQLYAMLYSLGYGGSLVFVAWPWWAIQLGFRLCEVGMCLPLAVVSMYPIFCSRETPKCQCWSKFFCLSPGHVNMKAPILQNNCPWAESQHEKLMICETIARSDSEFLPLYTLVEKHFSSGDDFDLMYHSNKSMDFVGSDFNLKNSYGSKTSSFTSVQLDSDSTVDFRPPSPINLRRSIDEALFGEALILKSLFPGPALSSSLSLNIKSAALPECDIFKEKAADRGLYRTSSCMEIETTLPVGEPSTHPSRHETAMPSPPGQWRGEGSRSSSVCKLSLDGSSLVLCSNTEKTGCTSSFSFDAKTCKNLSQANISHSSQAPGRYQALAPPSQESLDTLVHRSMELQEELMDVCRQIDTFSVNSETIDL